MMLRQSLSLWLARHRLAMIIAAMFAFMLLRGLMLLDGWAGNTYYSIGKSGMPWSDALTNWSLPALNLIDGLGLGKEGQLSARAPGMALYVGMFFELAGFRPGAVHIGNTVLLALYVPLLFMLTVKIFRSIGWGVLAVSPALVAPNLLPWSFAWAVMTEVPVMVLLLALVLATLEAVRSTRLAVIAGLLFGFLIVIKPTGALLGLLVPAFLLGSTGSGRLAAMRVTGFACGCAAWFVPLMIRSIVAFGDVDIVGTANLIAATEPALLAKFTEEEIFGRAEYAAVLQGEGALREALRGQISVFTNPIDVVQRLGRYLIAGGDGVSAPPIPLHPGLLASAAIVTVAILRRRTAVLRSRMDLKGLLFVAASVTVYALVTATHPMYSTRYALPFYFIEFALLASFLGAGTVAAVGRSRETKHSANSAPCSADRLFFLGTATCLSITAAFALVFFFRYWSNQPIDGGCVERAADPPGNESAMEYRGSLRDLYRQAAATGGDLSGLAGRRVRWAGMIEPIAIVTAHDDLDGRTAVRLPYTRILAMFRGEVGTCATLDRIWLDIPVQLPDTDLPGRFSGQIEAVIAPYEQAVFYERFRLRAERVLVTPYAR